MFDPYAFESFQLDNGLTVLAKHIPYASICRFGVVVKVGGRDGKRGITHLLEHVLTLGKKEELEEKIKDTGGGINLGMTSLEMTQFRAHCPPGLEPLALGALADVVFHPLFPEELFEAEKEVVMVEILGKVNPKLNEELLAIMERMLPEDGQFLSWHSLHLSGLGTCQDIRETILQEVREHYSQHYCLKNMAIFAVGFLETEKMLRLIDEHFSPRDAFPGGVGIIRKKIPTPVVPRQKRVVVPVSSFVCQETFTMSYLSGRSFSIPEDFRENFLLLEATWKRFFRKARARGAIYSPRFNLNPSSDLLACSLECMTSKDPAILESELLLALQESSGDRADFEREKKREILRKKVFNESSRSILEAGVEDFLRWGRVLPLEEEVNMLEEISFERYSQAAARLLENMAWLIIHKD